MQQKGIWLPLIASIGVGAATFYSMRKNNNQGMGQIMQQFMSGNNSSGNSNNGQHNSEFLGPFGMS